MKHRLITTHLLCPYIIDDLLLWVWWVVMPSILMSRVLFTIAFLKSSSPVLFGDLLKNLLDIVLGDALPLMKSLFDECLETVLQECR